MAYEVNLCRFTFQKHHSHKNDQLSLFFFMYHFLTNLFVRLTFVVICSLVSSAAWGQAPAPPTGPSSETRCSGFAELGVNFSCPTSTTASYRSPDGTVVIDNFFVLFNIPVGVTSYTLICTNASSQSSTAVFTVTGISPDPPLVTNNLPNGTAATGQTISLTASCPVGQTAVWDDDNNATAIRTVTAPNSATMLVYSATCQFEDSFGTCVSSPESTDIAVVAVPGSPTLTLGNSATFCIPTESCGGTFLYNSVICPVGWVFYYRDQTGMQFDTYAQSGAVMIPYAPSGTHPMPRILNFTVFCGNPATGQASSSPLTIYVGQAPPAPTLRLVIKP